MLKNLMAFLLPYMLSVSVTAGNDYLRIEIGTELFLNYPKGTFAKVYLPEGYLIYSGDKSKSNFEYEGDFKVEVFPSYSDRVDVFDKVNSKLKIRVPKTMQQNDPHLEVPGSNKRVTNKDGAYIGPVSCTKEIVLSEEIPGTYNLNLQLSNGVYFQYLDGKAQAFKDGWELTIKGKYILYTEKEEIKISFNPSTGKSWYIVTPYGRVVKETK